MLEALVRDCRHAGRQLLKSPGFALTAVIVLALGIGANAAIFSIVDGVLLRPLPYPDAPRIVRVWHTPPPEQFPGMTRFAVSPANYLDWRAQGTVFERMAIFGFRRLALTGGGDPEALRAFAVSDDFFSILGVPPLLGRLLGPSDMDEAHEHTIVISERLWKTRFGGDPTIVGRTVGIDGAPYIVAGVVSAASEYPPMFDAWVPLVWTPQERAVRGNHNYAVIAKLRVGVDVRQAQAEMTTISRRLERLYPADDKGWGAGVATVHDTTVGDVRWSLLVLLGAVACVLLIACANLANLLLARVLGRGREIAIRAAVGASRGRIIQQLLVESTVLAFTGAAVGIIAARSVLNAIVTSFGDSLPRATGIGIDGRVLAFTAAIALLTGLVAGVAPAWRMTRGDAAEGLKLGMGRGGTHAGERRVRSVLVTSEVALALVLLVGAGLLIRTLWQLRAVDPGIDPRNVVTMSVMLPRTKYPEAAQRTEFFRETLRRIRALPGVESAAAIDMLPVEDAGSIQPVAVVGQPVRPMSEQPEAAVRIITAGYVPTVRMRVLEGRDFTDDDAIGRPLAALVSASTARRLWPHQSPVGQHIVLGLISNEPREVVGVVSDVKVRGLASADAQAIYVPSTQVAGPFLTFAVRTAVTPQTIVPSITAAVHAVDPQQPVTNVQTLDEVIGESIAQQRFAMRLLTAFASLALLLAAVGIYGVLSYTVRQRVQEIGIRMALGAASADVLRMVVIEGMRPTVIGLAAGLAGAAALGRLLDSLVFGVTSRDTATFGAVSVIVLVVGLIASLLPAWRATRVDPLAALRAE